MKTLVLTLDYELYGNGSGDVFKHIIEPTYKLLDIAKKFHIVYTIFFEVVEYWKLKEEWEKGNKMGYVKDPILAIDEQIRSAYQQGHDIQLHLHPQWVDAFYKDDKWVVNNDEWKLGTYQRDGKYSLENLLRLGKETLECILRPIDANYECMAIRAGGYNIQPSKNLVKAMKVNDIYVDTSIYPGGKETGSLSVYDYTTISPEKEYWHVGNELEKSGNSEIIEFPIVAFPIVRISKYLSFDRIKSFMQNRKSAKDTFESKTGGSKSGIWRKIHFFFEHECQTWDFCLFSNSMHKMFLKKIEKQNRNISVLVCHPKSFVGSSGLEYLLHKTKGKYDYLTISRLYELYSKK